MPDLQTLLKPLPQKPQIASSDRAWKLNEILIPKIWKIENGIHSERAVGEFEQANRVKLEELERQRNRLTIAASIAGIGGTVGMLVSPMLVATAATLPPLSLLLGRLQTTSQRYFVMQELIKEFEEENIAIEVGLKPDGLREIDFFLRFPSKEFLLLQLRALGSVKVSYNEEREILQFRNKGGSRGGGLKHWKFDPLIELSEQERWLRYNRSDLLGTSSNDKRRPIAKALILMSETILDEHPSHLWDTMDQQNYLTVRRKGTFMIVEKDRVTAFIRSYLASRRTSKT